MPSLLESYRKLVEARLKDPAQTWFRTTLDEFDLDRFRRVYAGAGRRLGPEPIALTEAESGAVSQLSSVSPAAWPLRDLGRCVLLLRAVQAVARDEQPAFVDRIYKTGDNAEREALLRSLSLLPEPARFAHLATEACRSHVQTVFEALACENPFPAAHLEDLAFNQMVLKAFFTEVPVTRIVGLKDRRTAELARMAEDYAAERRAAGRPVPSDLNLVTE